MNESNIITLENYEVKSTTEAINKLTVKYTDYTAADNQGSVTVDSLAAMQPSSLTDTVEVVQTSREYWGASTAELAAKLATRDINIISLPLSKITIIVNRKAYKLKPGDRFVFEWPSLGISSITMRVTVIDVGGVDNNVLRVDAMADVFSFGDAIVTTSPATQWSDPSLKPPNDIPSNYVEAWELSFLEGVNRVPAFDSSKAYVSHTCLNPSRYYTGYRYLDTDSIVASYTDRGSLAFASGYSVDLAVALDLEFSSTVVTTTAVSTVLRATIGGDAAVLGRLPFAICAVVLG